MSGEDDIPCTILINPVREGAFDGSKSNICCLEK